MPPYEFSFDHTTLKLYDPVLDHVLNGRDGEVGDYLRKRGRLIVIAAKRQVGVDTGELKQSIHMNHLRDGFGQYLWIGSEDPIAWAHHDGTRPHVIRPVNRQLLRFSSGGRIIYTRKVNHPGTKPNRYLADNLILVRV